MSASLKRSEKSSFSFTLLFQQSAIVLAFVSGLSFFSSGPVFAQDMLPSFCSNPDSTVPRGTVSANKMTISEGTKCTSTVVNFTAAGTNLTNNGTIAVTVAADSLDIGSGVLSMGPGAAITNGKTGVIELRPSTKNARSFTGILSFGHGVRIENRGEITDVIRDVTLFPDDKTIGGASSGILSSSGNNVTIINSGKITVGTTEQLPGLTRSRIMSTASKGIGVTRGNDVTITNSATGVIKTFGGNSHGIYAAAISDPSLIGTTITNSGSITTSGDKSHGIYLPRTPNGKESSGTKITSTGSITTSGDKSHGIYAGGNARIVIGGSVSAAGAGSYAVKGSFRGSQTLKLLQGASVVGRVDLGGDEARDLLKRVEEDFGGDDKAKSRVEARDFLKRAGKPASNDATPEDILTLVMELAEKEDNDVVEVYADYPHSATYFFKGAEEVNLCSEFVGEDYMCSKMERLEIRHSDAGNTLVVLVDPTGQSATRITLGATTGRIHRRVFQHLASPGGGESGEGVWGSFSGSYMKRGGEGLAQSWRHNFYGGVLGYDIPGLSDGVRAGVFAGGGRGDIRTSATSVRDFASRVFFGVYGEHSNDGFTLDGSLMLGYASHDSERLVRNLSGYETAKGDYDSFYVSPSLSMTYAHSLGDGFELRPGVQLAYTYGRFGSYTEEGTVHSNINFMHRNTNIVDARTQLALTRGFADGRGEVELRGGGTIAYYGGDRGGARLGDGDIVSYRIPGDDMIHGGYAGLKLDYSLDDDIVFGGDVEYMHRSGQEDSVAGYLNMKVRF